MVTERKWKLGGNCRRQNWQSARKVLPWPHVRNICCPRYISADNGVGIRPREVDNERFDGNGINWNNVQLLVENCWIYGFSSLRVLREVTFHEIIIVWRPVPSSWKYIHKKMERKRKSCKHIKQNCNYDTLMLNSFIVFLERTEFC